MDTYSYEDYIYLTIGFVGAFIGAIAVVNNGIKLDDVISQVGIMVPNIYRVTRRFKSKDISYTYQIMLATGILLLGIYFVYYKSLLAFPTLFSATLNYYVAGLKFYIEKVHTPREAMDGGCIEDAEHKSLIGDDERGENGRGLPKGYGTKSHNTMESVT